MIGRGADEAKARLRAAGADEAEAAALAPHKSFAGNRPSVTLAYRRLDPFALGRLIALHEHRVFVEAAIWAINAFDHWGVELGQELATALLPIVAGERPATDQDSSTRGLVAHLAGLATS